MYNIMTKLSRKSLDPKAFGHYINNLWSSFTLMDSKVDIRLLLKDLLTHTEYKMFAKRLEIARRLIEKQTYEQIQKELNVTSRTISDVNNTLAEAGGGYRKAHEKLNNLEERIHKHEKNYIKILENPLSEKVIPKTVLGTLLKTGIRKVDKKISLAIKHRSAKKEFFN